MRAEALRVIADDLTGACDVAAVLAPWPGGVIVDDVDAHRTGGAVMPGLVVTNTQSRTLPADRAARRVYGALAGVPRGTVTWY